MIYIEKSTEPLSLFLYRKHSNACYADLPADVKNDIRSSLLKEQGYICAYCMNRIDDNHGTKIEHFKPQTHFKQDALNYSNMLLCCMGEYHSNNEKQLTCDSQKKDRILNINPCNKSQMDNISYKSSDGSIVFPRSNELDTILNLNIEVLRQNRKTIIDTLNRVLRKKFQDKTASIGFLNELLKKYSQKENGKFITYVGVYRWYLLKHIKKSQTTKE